MVAGVHGVRTSSRRWHLSALVLFAAAIATYETVAGVIALVGLVYRPAAPSWRAIWRPWAAAAGVTAVTLLYLRLAGGDDREAAPLTPGFVWSRLDDFWRPGLGVDLLPAQGVLAGPVGVVLAVVAAAGVAAAVRRGGAAGRAPRRWLALGAGGAVLGAAGWLLMIPGGEYYSPVAHGMANRVNVTAVVFGAVALAAVPALLGIGLAQLVRRPGIAPWLAGGAFAVAVVGLVVDERRHQHEWEEAYRHAEEVMSAVRGTVPELPPGGAVVTSNHQTTHGAVPVFHESWDLRGAVRLEERDRSVDGRPLLPGSACTAGGLRHADGDTWAFGALYFVDVGGFRSRRIPDLEACEAALAEFPPPSTPWG
jgi:hypothetical protein